MYDGERIGKEVEMGGGKEGIGYDGEKMILVFEERNEERREEMDGVGG